MKISTVIFDLDGTLIDSGASILNSIQYAFCLANIKPTKPLTLDLIGPPLKDIFQLLTREANQELLTELIENFKKYYDLVGYKETILYAGVAEMLDELKANKLKLYIATNKRIQPTLKILDYLGLKEKFIGVYALDCYVPNLINKNIMLQRLYLDLPSSKFAIYVGDREEDAEAAAIAGFPFYWASWGYGNNRKCLNGKDSFILKSPLSLPFIINENL